MDLPLDEIVKPLKKGIHSWKQDMFTLIVTLINSISFTLPFKNS